MKKEIVSSKLPKAVGPYSAAIEIDNTIYVSGQLPINADGVMKSDIESQTKQSLDNVKAIMEESGLTMNNIVKTTVLLKDMNDFAKMNDVYGSYFEKPYPARVCFEVAKLPKDALVEIEVVAVK